jgi:hypothetical protein
LLVVLRRRSGALGTGVEADGDAVRAVETFDDDGGARRLLEMGTMVGLLVCLVT